MTFTPTDWYVPQTVTVAADHDADATDETIMTIAHLVSSVDDSNFDGVIADSVTVTVRDDDGGANTSKTSLDHDTAAVRGANGQGLISTRAAALKIDFALVAPEPVREDAGTVRIEVVAATYSPGEPSDREIGVIPYNNTAKWGRDYRLGGWTDDEYYVADEQVEFLSGDFEPFVDIEGDTRYRAVKYFDIDIINDSLTEDAESFDLTFEDAQFGDVGLSDHECASVYEIEVTIIDDDPPVQMEYSLVEAGPFEEDAGTVQVEVVAVTNEAGVPNTEYAVGVQSEDVTANWPGDYAEVDETLDFPLGDFAAFVNNVGDTRYRQTVSFDVVIADDRFDEGTETFRLKLSESPEYEGSVFGVPEIEVTINDNDTAGVTVTPTELKIEEGNSDTYDVVLDTQPSSDVTVTINDPANPEITAEPASWTFTPDNWDEPRTVTVTADHDNDRIDEAAATITHTVTSTFDQYNDLSADSVTVTVTDGDVLSVAVSFEHSSYEVAESDDASTMDKQENEATVKVTLSADPERTVDIPLILTNQGGASDADYSGVPTSVTFNSGEMSKSFTFTAADDGEDDDGESVKLTFGTPPEGVNAGSVPETIVTITDDDAAGVAIDPTTLTVTEGDAVGESYTVRLDSQPSGDVVVAISGHAGTDLTLSGDTLSADYKLTFTFDDWSAAQRVTVKAEEDDDATGDAETLSHAVSVGSAAEYIGVAISDVAVTITDNDAVVTIAADAVSVTEGAPAAFTLTRAGNTDTALTVVVSVTEEGEYISGAAPTSASFEANDVTTSLIVATVDDGADEANGSVTAALQAGTGYVVGTDDAGTVTITDDDVPASVAASFSAPTYPVTEGGSVEVTVNLSEDPEREIVIPISRTNQGGATDSDYRGVPPSVTFNSGEMSESFTVEAVADNLEDVGESVKLWFDGTLPDGVSAGSTSEATVTIADGIAQNSLAVSFEFSEYTLPEGATTMVTVTLNAAPGSEVTIPLVPTGEGETSDADYSGVPASVIFNATDISKSFPFRAEADDVDDDGESLKLTFGTLPAGVSAGSITQAIVTITDDETVMEVSFGKSNYTVDEGHEVEVMVRLYPAPDHKMDIQLKTTDMNGASEGDYNGVPSMLTFERGDPEKTFTFFAELDDENEDREAVELSFVALPAMVREGDPSRALVSLRDNGGSSKDGITCIDNNRANIVTVLSGRGVISSSGEIDTWVIPGVDPYRTYLVEILGADSSVDVWGQDGGGGLTLADPHPVSLYHEDERIGGDGYNSAPGDFGTGRNSRFIFIFNTFGDFVLKVKSGESADDQGTGSYRLLVRYDNYCIVTDDGRIVFPFEGGPEGYAFDILDDIGTRWTANVQHSTDIHRRPYFAGGHFLGDNWGSEPDEDWVRFDLEGDTEYEVSLEGADHYPVEHRLMRPRIVGIFDQDGQLFHEGAAGSGTDTSVSLTFQTASSGGKYYLGVGSNPGDRTGVYSYHVRQTESNNARRAANNNSPTGGPGIKGLPRIGEELTATTSGIADADGLENASFSYQWVRHDPLANTDTDIPGATGSTYTVTRQDRDRAIKVRVEFTDDGGNDEKLTSFALLILPPVNTPATGQPTIIGALQVGQTLIADTSEISDADGMDNATFGYRWIAGDSDIQNATGMSHTLTEDEEGLAIRVSVTFTDNAEKEETLTSDPTGLVQPRPNGPVIRGVARVGETLTADTSGISDADGMENASFAYRWLAGGTDIPGATGSNYTLTAGEQGKTIKVRVSFTDDADNQETLTSAATEAVAARPNTSATGLPTIGGTAQVGEVLTADTSGIGDADGLTNPTYSYQWVAGGTDLGGATGSTYTLTAGEQGKTIKVRVSFTDDADNQERLTSAATEAVAARPNTSATGRPTISGTVRVGETLTADISSIADDDGLTNVSYRYQWVVTDRGAYLDIPGETGATYTLVAIDRGLYIQVRVSFTDDAGNREKLTSAVTEVVAAAP